MRLADSFPKVLMSTVPLIWLKPNEIANDEHNYKAMYACPVYKTSDRRGVLSTSGHSSNYIMYMYMNLDPSCHSEQFWTKRGVAMISQTDD
jgi:dynein heavy chain